MDLYALVHALLCHRIGHAPELKIIPLRILWSAQW